MKKNYLVLIVFLVLFVILILGYFLFFNQVKNIDERDVKESVFNQKQENSLNQVEVSQINQSYDLQEVSFHNNKQSCWTVINNEVFDLTKWISNHPGGEKSILKLCGRDGTLDFLKQHEFSKKANEALKSFKIGILKNNE